MKVTLITLLMLLLASATNANEELKEINAIISSDFSYEYVKPSLIERSEKKIGEIPEGFARLYLSSKKPPNSSIKGRTGKRIYVVDGKQIAHTNNWNSYLIIDLPIGNREFTCVMDDDRYDPTLILKTQLNLESENEYYLSCNSGTSLQDAMGTFGSSLLTGLTNPAITFAAEYITSSQKGYEAVSQIGQHKKLNKRRKFGAFLRFDEI